MYRLLLVPMLRFTPIAEAADACSANAGTGKGVTIEYVICNSAPLKSLDERLRSAVLEKAKDTPSLIDQHQKWLQARRATCEPVPRDLETCLIDLYKEQIAKFSHQQRVAAAPAPDPRLFRTARPVAPSQMTGMPLQGLQYSILEGLPPWDCITIFPGNYSPPVDSNAQKAPSSASPSGQSTQANDQPKEEFFRRYRTEGWSFGYPPGVPTVNITSNAYASFAAPPDKFPTTALSNYGQGDMTISWNAEGSHPMGPADFDRRDYGTILNEPLWSPPPLPTQLTHRGSGAPPSDNLGTLRHCECQNHALRQGYEEIFGAMLALMRRNFERGSGWLSENQLNTYSRLMTQRSQFFSQSLIKALGNGSAQQCSDVAATALNYFASARTTLLQNEIRRFQSISQPLPGILK